MKEIGMAFVFSAPHESRMFCVSKLSILSILTHQCLTSNEIHICSSHKQADHHEWWLEYKTPFHTGHSCSQLSEMITP